MFQQRVGGSLYRTLQSGSNSAFNTISDTLRSRAATLRDSAIGLAVIAGVLGLVWALSTYWRKRRGPTVRYDLPDHEVRREVLHTLAKLERLLRRSGFDARLPSQTLADYLSVAADRFSRVKEHLEWFRRAGWAAAYDERTLDPAVSAEAAKRLSELKRRGRFIAEPDRA